MQSGIIGSKRGIFALAAIGVLAVGMLVVGFGSYIWQLRRLQRVQILHLQEQIVQTVRRATEYGYFSGQRDAIAGDIRIGPDPHRQTWEWKLTPWRDGAVPQYKLEDAGRPGREQHGINLTDERTKR